MVVAQCIYAAMALSAKAAFTQGMSPLVFVVYRQAIATLFSAPTTILARGFSLSLSYRFSPIYGCPGEIWVGCVRAGEHFVWCLLLLLLGKCLVLCLSPRQGDLRLPIFVLFSCIFFFEWCHPQPVLLLPRAELGIFINSHRYEQPNPRSYVRDGSLYWVSPPTS